MNAIRTLALLLIVHLLCSSAFAEVHLRVGISCPLSGPWTEYGTAVVNGITLAKEVRPERFSHVAFYIEDDRYDPKVALAALQKLTTLNDIDLLFAWGNEVALALAPVLEREKIPGLLTAQHKQAAAGYNYVIRTINPFDDYQAALLKHLRKNGVRNIGLIQAQISFYDGLVDSLQKQLNNDESLTVVDKLLPGDQDLQPLIGRLKNRNFDILGVYLIPGQLGQFFKKAQEQHYRPKVFGATPFENRTVVDNWLSYMEGAVFTNTHVDEEFRTRYRARFGSDYQISYAANAYDMANLLADSLGSAGHDVARDEALAALKAPGEHHGVEGTYKLEKRADGSSFVFPIAVKQIRNSEIVEISEN